MISRSEAISACRRKGLAKRHHELTLEHGCVKKLFKGNSLRRLNMIRTENSRGAFELVYFLRCKENGLVKIGKAGDPERRKKNLEACSPLGTPLEFINVFLVPWGTERLLHKYFSKYRRHGEWFEFSSVMAEWLDDASR